LALPQNTHQSTHDTFHVDRIKKYQPAEPELFPNRVQNLRPDPDVIDGVEMYEVEDILAERRVRKRGRISLQYLVKWKGYSSAEASWEYAISLRRAAEVVRRYKARKQQEQEEDEIHQDEEDGPQPDTNSED
jgi:Chromo (CHRromatin Organisation MOdifier) domain